MKVKELLDIMESGTGVRIQFNIYNYSTCICDEVTDMKDIANKELLDTDITSIRAGDEEIVLYVDIERNN